MKEAMKKSKDASGIMSLNKNLVKDVDDTVKKWIDSAKKQGQDIDKMGEQEIKYIVELNKPKAPHTLQELMNKIGLNDPKKNRFLQKKGEVVDMSGKTIQKPENIMGGMEGIKARNTKIQGLADQLAKMQKEKSAMYGKKPTDVELKSKLEGMNKKTIERIKRRRYEAALKAEREKMAKDPYYIPKILDPEDFAEGGRTGYFTGALADTEEGKSMSPGTSHDYSPGQGHRATADANKQLAEIVKMHNMKAESMELPEKPKRSIKDKIGGGINRFFNNPLVRGAAAYGTFGGSEKLRAAMMAKELYDNRKYFTDDAIEEEVSNIPTMGGITPAYAQGGRTGTGLNYLLGEDDQNSRVPFSIGGFNKARRAFLKVLGAGAATGAAAKTGLFSLLKAGKPAAVETLTSVPIGNAAGMPAWFKPLVNKVIKEGTESGGEAERIIVHQTKLPNSKTDVYVTQDLNTGDVAVDIGIGKHGFADGHLGQPVRLEYKASEVIEPSFSKNKETINKAGKTKEEFWVEEAEFTGGHPENVKFEESTFNKYGEHGSNFDEVEMFATGKVKKVKKATGGRVPLAEGNTPSDTQLEQYYRNLEEEKKRRRLQREFYEQRFGGPGPILEASQGGLAGLLGE